MVKELLMSLVQDMPVRAAATAKRFLRCIGTMLMTFGVN
jgi:hypothetical protein